MLLPKYKDTALMCRSFAEQLVNGLMPVDTNLEVLKRRINYRRKSKACLFSNSIILFFAFSPPLL